MLAARARTMVAATLPVSRGSSRSRVTATTSFEGRQQARRPPPRPLLRARVTCTTTTAAAAAAAAAAASASAADSTAATTEPIETKLGPLKIRPLTKEDTAAAAVVLARAFTANSSSPPLADVEEWLSGSLGESPSETCVLVAELVPENKELLAPGKQYRVAGVAAVAKTAAAAEAAVGENSFVSRSSFPLLCNVAVDPRMRRLGIGRALVSAAEVAAKESSAAPKALFVVARSSEDAAAERLYSSLGFAEVEVESEKKGGNLFSSLFGSKASAEKLMKKEL